MATNKTKKRGLKESFGMDQLPMQQPTMQEPSWDHPGCEDKVFRLCN